jgi:hypothetical protein
MGECPSSNHSIERLDVNGHYEPSNCCWLLLPLQARNKRNSRMVTIGTETKSLPAWCALYGAARQLVRDRLNRGWDPLPALTLPPGAKRAA